MVNNFFRESVFTLPSQKEADLCSLYACERLSKLRMGKAMHKSHREGDAKKEKGP